jgi:ankyrin repeat protein
VRSIQAQLSLLLPNNVTEWRQYRPTAAQGKARLAQLKRSRENHISKYARRKSRIAVNIESNRKSNAGTPRSDPTFYYNPSRHYDDESPAGVPSHFEVSRSSASSSWKPLPTVPGTLSAEVFDEDRYSDKETVTNSDKETIHPPSGLHVCTELNETELTREYTTEQTEMDRSTVTAFANSNNAIATTETLPEEPSAWPPAESSPSIHTVEDNATDLPRGGLKRSHSQLSSIRSIRSMRSIGSKTARSISDRMSRLSRSFSDVESVLSTTNSWRSSLIYAMSVGSGQDHLTRDEYLSWDALVDESRFASKSRNRPEMEAKSLRTRPCCEFFENDLTKRTKCNVCGFSEMHQLARTSMSDDGGLINASSIDRFGNTPLHHAAAAGNSGRVIQLMLSAGQPPVQNTSGETYLHVLDLGVNDRFSEYIEILTRASSLGFDFSIRDYNCETAASKLREVVLHWNLDSQQHDEIARVLNIGKKKVRMEDISSLPNIVELPDSSPVLPAELPGPEPWQGFLAKELIRPRRHKKQPFPLNVLNVRRDKSPEVELDEIDKNGDTPLIAALKNWSASPKSSRQLEKLVKQSDIHMRDNQGYTALAVAVRYGLRDAASLLLKSGANPNTRSYEGNTSMVDHASKCMAKAQKEQDDRLYAKILSCMVLLTDYGGKARVSVYDEYTVLSIYARRKEKSSQSTPTINQVQNPLDTIEEDQDKSENNNASRISELSGGNMAFEAPDTAIAIPIPELAPGERRFSPEEYFEAQNMADMKEVFYSGVNRSRPESRTYDTSGAAKTQRSNPRSSNDGYQAYPLARPNPPAPTKCKATNPPDRLAAVKVDQKFKANMPQSPTRDSLADGVISEYLCQPSVAQLQSWLPVSQSSGPVKLRKVAKRSGHPRNQSSQPVRNTSSTSLHAQNILRPLAPQTKTHGFQPKGKRSISKENSADELNDTIDYANNRPKKRRLNSGKSSREGCGAFSGASQSATAKVSASPMMVFGSAPAQSFSDRSISSGFVAGIEDPGRILIGNCLENYAFNFDRRSNLDYSAPAIEPNLSESIFGDNSFGIHDVSLERTSLRRTELASERQNASNREAFPNFPRWPAEEIESDMDFNVGRLSGDSEIARNMGDSSRPSNGCPNFDLHSSVSSYPLAWNIQETNRRPGTFPSEFIELNQASAASTMTSWSVLPDPTEVRLAPDFLDEGGLLDETWMLDAMELNFEELMY